MLFAKRMSLFALFIRYANERIFFAVFPYIYYFIGKD